MTSPYQPPPPQSGMTPAQLAELLALVQAQAAIRQHLTQAAVKAAVDAFTGFGDWWNPDAVKKVIAQALKTVIPAQKQAAVATDAYLTRAARLMTGKAGLPTGGAIDVSKLRRAIPDTVARQLVDGVVKPPFVVLGDTFNGPGPHINQPAPLVVRGAAGKAQYVPAADPYGRVADQYRFGVITQGLTEEQAQAKALVRIAAVAETDVTAAVREQYHKTMGAQKANGYRRILHPELSKTGPCGLCVVAADRTYRVADLMPLHAACVCEVLPVYAKQDPGIDLNWQDLNAIYQAAGSTGGGKREGGALKKIRVALTENGELGPVLVDADQNYRGPTEVAKTHIGSADELARRQLEQWERSYETLSLRALRGENLSKSLTWQRDRIAQLRKQLGIDVTAPVPARPGRAGVNAA